jgi:hypothetical protein
MKVRWTRPIDGVRWREYICKACHSAKWTREGLDDEKQNLFTAYIHPLEKKTA